MVYRRKLGQLACSVLGHSAFGLAVPGHSVLGLAVRLFTMFALAQLAYGCTPDLGDAPFRCNSGNPECPEGYVCNGAKLCVREGFCPPGVAGCTSCGDGTCGKGEDCESCAKDCGECPAGCGDARCDLKAGETCETCAGDCGACACGNGTCDTGEDEKSCSEDCTPSARCGDKTCDAGETTANCPSDCPKVGCGDGVCEGTETVQSCPKDCVATRCGDGTCDSGETTQSCAKDCRAPGCGDGSCDNGETSVTCPKDCFCADDAMRCRDVNTVTICKSGMWKSYNCETTCQQQFGTRSVGCEYSTTKKHDVCKCEAGRTAGFGERCNSSISCETGFRCVRFAPSDADGFCTRACARSGAVCSGTASYQEARCSVKQFDGESICYFICDLISECPGNLICSDAWSGGICEP